MLMVDSGSQEQNPKKAKRFDAMEEGAALRAKCKKEVDSQIKIMICEIKSMETLLANVEAATDSDWGEMRDIVKSRMECGKAFLAPPTKSLAENKQAMQAFIGNVASNALVVPFDGYDKLLCQVSLEGFCASLGKDAKCVEDLDGNAKEYGVHFNMIEELAQSMVSSRKRLHGAFAQHMRARDQQAKKNKDNSAEAAGQRKPPVHGTKVDRGLFDLKLCNAENEAGEGHYHITTFENYESGHENALADDGDDDLFEHPVIVKRVLKFDKHLRKVAFSDALKDLRSKWGPSVPQYMTKGRGSVSIAHLDSDGPDSFKDSLMDMPAGSIRFRMLTEEMKKGLSEKELQSIKGSIGNLYSFALAKDKPVVAVEPHLLASVKYQVSGKKLIRTAEVMDLVKFMTENRVDMTPGENCTIFDVVQKFLANIDQSTMDKMNGKCNIGMGVVEPGSVAFIPQGYIAAELAFGANAFGLRVEVLCKGGKTDAFEWALKNRPDAEAKIWRWLIETSKQEKFGVGTT